MSSEWVSSHGHQSRSSFRWHREGIGADEVNSRKNMLEYLLDIGVDGVITDYPHTFRYTLERLHPDLQLAPKGDMARVLGCLNKHLQLTGDDVTYKGYLLDE